MLFTNHLIVTVATALVANNYLPTVFENKLLLIWVLLGSLLPDIDHPKSKIGRLVPWLSYPIAGIFGHRQITHSLLAVFGVSYFLFGNNAIAIALGIGYLSHLIGDFLTDSGCPLLWPYPKRFSFPITITTGGIMERSVALSVLVLAIFLIL